MGWDRAGGTTAVPGRSPGGDDEDTTTVGPAGRAGIRDGAASAAGLARIRAAAEAGDAEAMYLLGVAYAQGRLVPQSDVEAASWFRRAAARDHLRGRVSLGYCLATGRGVRRDLEKAYILLREAADAGDPQGFGLAEKVARRLHGEVLRRCDRQIRRRRILRSAGRKPTGSDCRRDGAGADPPSAGPPSEAGEIIEIDVP